MNRKKSIWLILILFFCLAGKANCREFSWQEIQKESAKITTIQARFTQSKHMKILSKPLVSKGIFYFQAPNSVRWEYNSPVKSILLMSREGGIKRYTAGSKGLAEEPGTSLQGVQMVLQEISKWTKGQFTDNPYFVASMKDGQVPQIIMTPREKGLASIMDRIVISFSPDRPGILKSVKIVENEGNDTLIEFSDVQINTKLQESLFRKAE
jgi:outer membrane lipoprotein-sorting protein